MAGQTNAAILAAACLLCRVGQELPQGGVSPSSSKGSSRGSRRPKQVGRTIIIINVKTDINGVP